MNNPVCSKCGQRAKLVSSVEIYGDNSPSLGYFYLCKCTPEWCYVGCYPNSTKPLGTLADAKLRKLRQQLHTVFSQWWKIPLSSRPCASDKYKVKLKSKAHAALAKNMLINKADCSVALFNEEQCLVALDIVYRGLDMHIYNTFIQELQDLGY